MHLFIDSDILEKMVDQERKAKQESQKLFKNGRKQNEDFIDSLIPINKKLAPEDIRVYY